ncbi:MAG: site-specific DNA-methyltransferase [Phycisphaerales bacterium]|nr:MAG: site-specific DNA-methyltransferase [Phycisphaerales bacterium]
MPAPTNTPDAGPRQRPRWLDAGTHARIACADWLDAAPDLAPASVGLLYADPPFNTGRDQAAHAGAYADRWATPDAHAAWLRERLERSLPALTPDANILIHVDWRSSHHVRTLLDDLLGPDRFVNHLIWSYGLGGSSPRRFARKHDDILYYCLHPDRHYFNPPMVPATSRRMRGQRKKATDVLDIPAINNMSHERCGWPTQKPLALLSLLVEACSPPGAAVLDPCCGSGTTLVAARMIGRTAWGVDTHPDAARIARERLLALVPSTERSERDRTS